MGTRDAIGTMRMFIQRSLEYNNNIYVCFVDFEKAFDRVRWPKMMNILKRIGVDWRERKLIAELYSRQEMIVRIDGQESEPCTVGRGVRQGCLISPLLFSLYAEFMMIEAMEGVEEEIKVGGKLLQNIRFADDQGMLASTKRGLQKIMDALCTNAEEYGMKINIKKTKVIVISKSQEKRLS